MSARIRLGQRDDLDDLLALEALFPSDRMSRRALRRFLDAPSARLWVAVQGRAVVGMVLLLLRQGARHGRVYSVVVAPEARGQGLGERLIATAERASRAAGRKCLRLEVRRGNQPARRLYEKRGYVEIARLSRYYADGAAGLRLEKAL